MQLLYHIKIKFVNIAVRWQPAGVLAQHLVLHVPNPYNSLKITKRGPIIAVLRRLRELYTVARRIWQTEGLPPLLGRGFIFLANCFFQYGSYYLYEINIPQVLQRNNRPEDFRPEIRDFTLKIVSTNTQADELEREGFEFRSRFFNARKRLDRGAIAFCIFVGRELANIGWITLNNPAKDSLIDLPLKVDYSNREACTGGAATTPKYRNLGLMRYNYFKRLEFLKENGWLRDRAAVSKSNIAAQAGVAKIGGVNIYAEARFLKLLWWRYWREKPLPPPRT